MENTELIMAMRAIVASALGALIGVQRERHGSYAGVRTYAIVSLGSCVFGLVSSRVCQADDPTRLAAQVVSGIGFLGAGVILREKGHITGLTTAATLWATAGVGLTIAYGMHMFGVLNALLILALLCIGHIPALAPDKKADTHGGNESGRK